MEINKIYQGDSLEVLKTFQSESIDMVMTSPPYWLQRDYGVPGAIGLEQSFGDYISNLRAVFVEVKRVLKPRGTCWVNIGDKYSNKGHYDNTGGTGHAEYRCFKYSISNRIPAIHNSEFPQKTMMQMPERFSLMMADELGFLRRSDIIWQISNCKPESIRDRFVYDYEHLYMFSKIPRYYFETQYEDAADSSNRDSRVRSHTWGQRRPDIGYPGHPSQGSGFIKPRILGKRLMRSVWKIASIGFKGAHSATYPERLCVTPILAGCPIGGIVLDPFAGAGTTCLVAKKLGRNYIGIELNREYIKMAEDRIYKNVGLL